MSVKKASRILDAKTPVCKEPGCSHNTQVRGYCRLHFLKMIKTKQDVAAGKVVPLKDAEALRDRRKRRRDIGPDVAASGLDDAAQEVIERVGEIDLDIGEIDAGLPEVGDPAARKAS